MIEADAEDQRDPQQRRQRRKQQAALEFREHRGRQAGMPGQLDEAHLLAQPERPQARRNPVRLEAAAESL